MLPQELGCGSGMTCWRRLRVWQEAGTWQLIHFAFLDWLSRFGRIDWSRAVVDSCSAGAVFGGQTGPNPTDRAKLGSQRHLICDGRGVPLAIQLTAANRNDSQQALSLVDAVPLLQGERGRPRHRPDCVLGDGGYDAEAIRRGRRARHILLLLAMRNTKHGSAVAATPGTAVFIEMSCNFLVSLHPKSDTANLVVAEATSEHFQEDQSSGSDWPHLVPRPCLDQCSPHGRRALRHTALPGKRALLRY
jgi:transposase